METCLMTETKKDNGEGVEIGIQRLYVKDASFESPQAPKVFTATSNPKIQLNLETKHQKLQDAVYEVSLNVTVTAENDKGPMFIIEVEQAGIFSLSGLSGETLAGVLGAYCPNVLFPYVRETIDALAAKGSFPPLMLAPVNFDALYQQQKQKKAKA